MAAYPSTPAYRTDFSTLTKVRQKIAESGKVHGSSLSEETGFLITVTHPYILEADFDSLKSFYTTNRYNDNTILANDGDTYDCWFQTDYSFKAESASRWTVSVRLLANRQ